MQHPAVPVLHDFGVWRPDFLGFGRHFATIAAPAARVTGLLDWPTPADFRLLFQEFRVRNHVGAPLLVAPCPPKPRGAKRRRLKKTSPGALSYEEQVYYEAQIPTRLENWHDFFNALVWCRFPMAKAALNQRQVEAREPGLVRTREQERLTLFDEGGIIKIIHRRHPTINDHFAVFGHALYESTLLGRLNVHAMTITVEIATAPWDHSYWQDIDTAVASLVKNLSFQGEQTYPRKCLSDLC